MGSLSLFHWIIILGVLLLLFGRGKITHVMSDFAQGIKAFKKGLNEDEDPERLASKKAEGAYPANPAPSQPVHAAEPERKV